MMQQRSIEQRTTLDDDNDETRRQSRLTDFKILVVSQCQQSWGSLSDYS